MGREVEGNLKENSVLLNLQNWRVEVSFSKETMDQYWFYMEKIKHSLSDTLSLRCLWDDEAISNTQLKKIQIDS